jgi:gluconolactonase
MTPAPREVATGLRFPEGPVAMPDGSVILVEIESQHLTRVKPDGAIERIVHLGGGPNGAAIGPDGRAYICNNGGFWFTDLGKARARDVDRGSVCYAKADGSMIREVIFPMWTPNGIGLSPDQKTLYVAETATGRVWAFDISAPGEIARQPWPASPHGGRLLAGLPGFQNFDSLAVDSAGNVCVATLMNGGITVIAPDGASTSHIPMPDEMTTNICFGGPDLRTAYITLSSVGKLVAMDWPRPGLPLNYLNR